MERAYDHGAGASLRGGGPRAEASLSGGGPKAEASLSGGGPRAGASLSGGGPKAGASVSGGGPKAGASVSGGPSGKNTNRFGPSESKDSGSSLVGSDLYRSGHGYNEPERSRRNSLDSFRGRNQGGASWEASLARGKMRTGFTDERGRESNSSYSGFASPPMKPAPAGSRGGGNPSFREGSLGSRSHEALGGMPAGRGRGMGLLIVVDYQNKTVFGTVPGDPAGRGTKRELMPPPNALVPGALDNKKPKLTESEENTNKEPDAKNKEEVEKRRAEARLKKKMRKRERYGYRSGFTCVFCKFGTFEEKQIEAHLASTSHQETLKHIQAHTKFDKVFMEFLHESVVDKCKKTSLRIERNKQLVAAKLKERDLLEGVSSDDHMMKMETIHCSACSMYFPASRNSIHEHINSSDHVKCKQAFKALIKRESVFTATSFYNNPLVMERYKKFAKGENPFEIADTTDENAAEANENEGNVQNEEDEDSGEEAAEPN